MKRVEALKHKFVEFIPEELEDGTIYVSIAFATVAHRCCCGCGSEVITPLSPTDWTLIYDGQAISLDPSIGNWSFDCQSHYWISRNRVKWARRWSQERIANGRARDSLAKQAYFDDTKASAVHDAVQDAGGSKKGYSKEGRWRKLKKWFF